MTASLRTNLLQWHDLYGRHDLPWNNTKDPYLIWLSEVILQQTQVAQGLPYYQRFVERFPDVFSLAKAPMDDVLKLWEGLGYYSRARNLQKGATYIVEECGGSFPATRTALLQIPGVGPYTSAAIASFAYELPHPVVDGNVIRILSRVHGITASVQEKKIIKQIEGHAQDLMQDAPPAALNRAMMDLGATVCRSKKPNCDDCPWQECCVAYKEDLQDTIPFKHKKVTKKDRTIHFLIKLDEAGNLITTKRNKKDIWQGLYTLPEVMKSPGKSVIELDHHLTHRRLKLYFYTEYDPELLIEPIQKALTQYAYPVAIKKALQKLI